MMKYVLGIIFTLFLFQAEGHIRDNSLRKTYSSYLKEWSQQKTEPSYQQTIQKIKEERDQLLRSYQQGTVSIDSCRNYFLDRYENHVFPHWIGTVWDYNGYSNTPGPDKLIACGYFVSTPLKHMGFNWNRYDLAKMYSKKIVETTCSEISSYSDKMKMILELKSRSDNMYFVGLDSHVGILLKEGEHLWFVHSNYIGLEGPVKEIASISLALDASQNYWVGTFLNDQNLERWLKGTLIPTPRD